MNCRSGSDPAFNYIEHHVRTEIPAPYQVRNQNQKQIEILDRTRTPGHSQKQIQKKLDTNWDSTQVQTQNDIETQAEFKIGMEVGIPILVKVRFIIRSCSNIVFCTFPRVPKAIRPWLGQWPGKGPRRPQWMK